MLSSSSKDQEVYSSLKQTLSMKDSKQFLASLRSWMRTETTDWPLVETLLHYCGEGSMKGEDWMKVGETVMAKPAGGATLGLIAALFTKYLLKVCTKQTVDLSGSIQIANTDVKYQYSYQDFKYPKASRTIITNNLVSSLLSDIISTHDSLPHSSQMYLTDHPWLQASILLGGGVVRDHFIDPMAVQEGCDYDFVVSKDMLTTLQLIFGERMKVEEGRRRLFELKKSVCSDDMLYMVELYSKDVAEYYGINHETQDEDPSKKKRPDLKIDFKVVGHSFYEDLLCKDLSINSMYFDPKNMRFLCHEKSLRDLESQTLDTLPFLDYDVVFQDPTRIFRAINFSSRLGFEYSPPLREYLEHAGLDKIYEHIADYEHEIKTKIIFVLLKAANNNHLKNLYQIYRFGYSKTLFFPETADPPQQLDFGSFETFSEFFGDYKKEYIYEGIVRLASIVYYDRNWDQILKVIMDSTLINEETKQMVGKYSYKMGEIAKSITSAIKKKTNDGTLPFYEQGPMKTIEAKKSEVAGKSESYEIYQRVVVETVKYTDWPVNEYKQFMEAIIGHLSKANLQSYWSHLSSKLAWSVIGPSDSEAVEEFEWLVNLLKGSELNAIRLQDLLNTMISMIVWTVGTFGYSIKADQTVGNNYFAILLREIDAHLSSGQEHPKQADLSTSDAFLDYVQMALSNLKVKEISKTVATIAELSKEALKIEKKPEDKMMINALNQIIGIKGTKTSWREFCKLIDTNLQNRLIAASKSDETENKETELTAVLLQLSKGIRRLLLTRRLKKMNKKALFSKIAQKERLADSELQLIKESVSRLGRTHKTLDQPQLYWLEAQLGRRCEVLLLPLLFKALNTPIN